MSTIIIWGKREILYILIRDGHAPYFADAYPHIFVNILAYLRIFAHICALSASFCICRICMAIPNIDTYSETDGEWVMGVIVWTLTLKQSNTASDDKTQHYSLQTAMCKYQPQEGTF